MAEFNIPSDDDFEDDVDTLDKQVRPTIVT